MEIPLHRWYPVYDFTPLFSRFPPYASEMLFIPKKSKKSVDKLFQRDYYLLE